MGSNLLISMLIGAIGCGYFIYGRKQMKASALVAGILLCIYPYFISNIWLMLLVGAIIMAVPFFIYD